MKRRRFLLHGAVGIVTLTIPISCHNFKDVVYDPILAQPKSLSLIWDPETINEIGNQYRKLTPTENKELILVKLLEETDFGSNPSIAQDFGDRIKKDFANGQTVMIDGWILSITEARQCALSSTFNTQ